MNGITIGIGAFVLGGWMLNSAPENQVEQAAPPVAASGEAATESPSGGTATTSGGSATLNAEQQLKWKQYIQKQQQERGERQPSVMQPGTQSGAEPFVPPAMRRMTSQPLSQSTSQAYQPGSQAYQPGSQAYQPGSRQPPMNSNSVLPVTPTEQVRSTTLAIIGMPSVPTATLADTNIDALAEAANQARGPGGAVIPGAPTGQQTYAPRTYQSSQYNDMDQMRMQSLSNTHPGFVPTQAIEKPLANAQLNSNGVSAWMNLYRNNHDNGVVNNYYTLVKPALDQRSMNQQFNLDIYGVERSNRIQSAELKDLNSTNQRQLQSYGTPQFYMNTGPYYPGYGQQGQAVGQ